MTIESASIRMTADRDLIKTEDNNAGHGVWRAASAKGGDDQINHPAHYTAHPSGVECIEITEHMNFCLGNAVKYLWRAGLKSDAIEDLEKARWYIGREIDRRKGMDQNGGAS